MLWNKNLETGNEIVDNQHKEIFKLVQDVLDSDAFENRQEKVEAALNFLAKYAVMHFASEEKLMQECNYPEYVSHKAMHDNFVKEVSEFVLSFEKDGESVDVSDVITNFVYSWLIEHVMHSDKKMAGFYKEWNNTAN